MDGAGARTWWRDAVAAAARGAAAAEVTASARTGALF